MNFSAALAIVLLVQNPEPKKEVLHELPPQSWVASSHFVALKAMHDPKMFNTYRSSNKIKVMEKATACTILETREGVAKIESGFNIAYTDAKFLEPTNRQKVNERIAKDKLLKAVKELIIYEYNDVKDYSTFMASLALQDGQDSQIIGLFLLGGDGKQPNPNRLAIYGGISVRSTDWVWLNDKKYQEIPGFLLVDDQRETFNLSYTNEVDLDSRMCCIETLRWNISKPLLEKIANAKVAKLQVGIVTMEFDDADKQKIQALLQVYDPQVLSELTNGQ